MENNELHTEKVKILSRLVKENYITLEEALLLLKEEEKELVHIPSTSTGTWHTSTTPNYTMPMFISSSGNIGMSTTNPSSILTTSSFTNSIAEEPADLNN
jgi:hypothetical protein